jgi:hypothetical protein
VSNEIQGLGYRQMRFPIAAIALCLGAGCSTLDVKDGYTLPDKSLQARLPVADGELNVGFIPATRFSSFGLAGAPVIPTVVHRHAPAEMNLSIGLTLRTVHDFALPAALCLGGEVGERLCSDRVMVHAVAMSKYDRAARSDDPNRWGHIAPFFDSKRPYYGSISADEHADSIDRAAIYRYYEYDGVPQWSLMTVELVYRFTCPGQCPNTAVLHGTSVRIDDIPATIGELEFRRASLHDYRPTTPVQ